MKFDKIALLAYVILCLLSIFANIYDFYGLKLLSKSLLIPVLFFYYLGNVNKIEILSCAYFLLNFIGDSIGIFDFSNEIEILIIPFFLSNVVLTLFLLKPIKKIKVSFLNLLPLLIILFFLTFMWFQIVDVFTFSEGNLQIKIGIYGLSIIVVTFLASYNIINRITFSNLYLLICVLCILLSDIFYVIHNFELEFMLFDIIHYSCQIFSYFFFVQFVIFKDKKSLA